MTETTTGTTAASNNSNSNNNSKSATNNVKSSRFPSPSYIAKSKLHAIYDQLPTPDLAATARTYTSRLHQLRMQRDHRQATYSRITTQHEIPKSCQFRFELGASPAVTDTLEYAKLKEQVETSLKDCQSTLSQAIGQVQLLEIQAKEVEIHTAFCQALAHVAVGFVNHHRDLPESRIAQSMQSQRLGDRLVEMLLEQDDKNVVEFAYFPSAKMSDTTGKNKNNYTNGIQNKLFQDYYKAIERNMPTHSRMQNKDTKSSPYNAHHTSFLKGILPEFAAVVEPCFHAMWKDYVLAKDKMQQEKEKEETNDNAAKQANKNSKDDSNNKKNGKKATASDGNANAIPSQDAVKEMVQLAVSEETQALREHISKLEQQLQQQKKTEAATSPSATTATEGNTMATPNKKGRGRRRRGNNDKHNETYNEVATTSGKEEVEDDKKEPKAEKDGKNEAKSEEQAKSDKVTPPNANSDNKKKGAGERGRGRGRGRGNANANSNGKKEARPDTAATTAAAAEKSDNNADKNVQNGSNDNKKEANGKAENGSTKNNDKENTAAEETKSKTENGGEGDKTSPNKANQNRRNRNRNRNRNNGNNNKSNEGKTEADTKAAATAATETKSG